MVCVSRTQQLPHVRSEPAPGPTAARAELWVMLRVIWESRFKRKNAVLKQLQERSGKCERKSPTATKVSVEGEKEVLQVQSRNSSQPRRGPWSIRLSLVAHGHHTQQTSMSSHGEPLEQPQTGAAAYREQPMVGQEGWGSCAYRDPCRAVHS